MTTPTVITFITYFLALLGIGLYFYRRSVSIEDYLLGGRKMGAWVTAFSAQASDMSGWLLMGLPDRDQEKVFIHMIAGVMHPWLVGIMLSAILSAIMSTIDSQLLVSSSALTEDFYRRAINRNAGQGEVVFVGRICVIVISLIAMGLALGSDKTILKIVAYAWGGFGAAFGPPVLFALFSRRTSWRAALLGMVAGAVTLVVWKRAGLSGYMYEIVPGFAVSFAAIGIVSRILPQTDPRVLRQFDEVMEEVRGIRIQTVAQEPG